jgi:cobalamin synthase
MGHHHPMSRGPTHTPSSTRSLRWALRCVAAAGLLIGVLELAITLAWPACPVWAVAGFVLVAWVYLAAGTPPGGGGPATGSAR